MTIPEFFLKECVAVARRSVHGSPFPPESAEDVDICRSEDWSVPSGSPPHAISKAETFLYYAGVSFSPPKLVYRSSQDPYLQPRGPWMCAPSKYPYPVSDHKLRDEWDDLLPKICGLLDLHQVRFSSIDLVRFLTPSNREVDSNDIISPVVIWIGVLPDTLDCEVAFLTANDVLAILKDKGITDVDVEFRESVFRRSAGAVLYEPGWFLDAARNVIDPLTTALSLPIAGANTQHLQGTMGFYFKDGDDLYGVTARHVLFPPDQDPVDYIYDPSRPRKQVLLMGTEAWRDYIESIKIKIGDLVTSAEIYRSWMESYEKGDNNYTPTANIEKQKEKTRKLLEGITPAIDKLWELYQQTKKDFRQPRQRVIGYVVWSPAITSGTAPHNFTKDVCVVKLDKDRFLPNFKGNVVDLGRREAEDMQDCKISRSMASSTETDTPFRYLFDHLLELKGVLAEDHLRHPDRKNYHGEICHSVIKRGPATQTTVGHATGYFSYTREYFPNQTHQDSLQWAILPDSDNQGSDAFAKRGDSGSVVISGTGEIGGLLTSGSGGLDPDIAYATPMFWLWPIIKAQFPNADLNPVFN